MFDPEEFDSALDDLEDRLERLHLLFKRFFSGAERTEPTALRDEIDHQLATLLMSQRHLGALPRVRLTLLHQRYDSYQQSWEHLAASTSRGARPRQASTSESSPPSPLERGSRGWSERAPNSERARSSPPAPMTGSLTPPLGTPSSAPLPPAPRIDLGAKRDRVPSVRPNSARTIRDFRAPLGSDSSHTGPDLPPAFEKASSEHETGVSMQRVREIHARLRASNARPPSLERLAKRLSETEAKLKALHGDRTVTFDVVLRDGKAIVKPIVH